MLAADEAEDIEAHAGVAGEVVLGVPEHERAVLEDADRVDLGRADRAALQAGFRRRPAASGSGANTRLGKQALLFALVGWYLSIGHRDGLATSCAVTSMASDVARSSDRARAAYTRQVNAYLELFGRLVEGDKPKARRLKALAAWTALVGALSMARAVSDDKLSREILTAADEVKVRLS